MGKDESEMSHTQREMMSHSHYLGYNLQVGDSNIEIIKIIFFKIEIPRKYQSFCGRSMSHRLWLTRPGIRSDQRITDEDGKKD